MTQTKSQMNFTRAGGVHIIGFAHADVLEADDLRGVRRHISRLSKSGAPIKLLLDLGHVVFLTSEAIGMIVVLHNAISPRGGQLHLANISDEMYTVFEMFKLQALLKVFNSTREAIEAFE